MIGKTWRPPLCAMFVLLLALCGACTSGPAVGGQQARTMQATFATVQAELQRTSTPFAPVATPVTSLATADSSVIATSGASLVSPGSVLASVLAAAPPAASPPPASPPKIGQSVDIVTEDGAHLAATVNRLIDPAQSTNPYTQPKGRWVVLDWTLANQGSIGHSVYAVALLLQTEDGFVYQKGLSTGLPQPELSSRTITQGQSVRGYVSYDVPAGAKLKSAIYQPVGNQQFMVADLAP